MRRGGEQGNGKSLGKEKTRRRQIEGWYADERSGKRSGGREREREREGLPEKADDPWTPKPYVPISARRAPSSTNKHA